MASTFPPPVQVRFAGLYEPDMLALAESLIPFGRWTEEHIAAELPVAVFYPTEIAQRLTALKGFLAPSGWPRQVPTDAIATVRAVVEQAFPLTEAKIVQALRLITAATVRDDGSRAIEIRDRIITNFLASQMMALARMLASYHLVGEALPPWARVFHGMPPVYSNDLIFGLSILAREPYDWAGWTEADLWVDDHRFRFFAPVCPAPTQMIKVETLPPEDVQRLIIPQLALSNRSGQISFIAVRKIIFEPWTEFLRRITLRDEIFVDSETCRYHPDARIFIIETTAARIVVHLQQLPPVERRKTLVGILHSLDSLSLDVFDRVRKAMAIN